MVKKKNPMPILGTVLSPFWGRLSGFQSPFWGRPVPILGTARRVFGCFPVPILGTSLTTRGSGGIGHTRAPRSYVLAFVCRPAGIRLSSQHCTRPLGTGCTLAREEESPLTVTNRGPVQ